MEDMETWNRGRLGNASNGDGLKLEGVRFRVTRGFLVFFNTHPSPRPAFSGPGEFLPFLII